MNCSCLYLAEIRSIVVPAKGITEPPSTNPAPAAVVLASCPGSRGGGEREPGTHRSRMRLIISNFCRFLRHRQFPTTMLRNNINKLAVKLLSFVGLYYTMLA